MGNNMVRRDSINDSEFRIHSQDQMLNLVFLTSNISNKEYTLRKIYKNKITQPQLKAIKKTHPHVTPLLEYRYDKDNIHLHLLFETPFLTLETLRLERHESNKYFTETELVGIFGQIVQGLA
jgi:hypothetical protein